MKQFEPMLAWNKKLVREKLQFPLWITPKLDGIRAMNIQGELVSRSLKPIRNEFVQAMFGQPKFKDIDGELIVGRRNAHDVYRKTNSIIMSYDKPLVEETTWEVFDCFTYPNDPYKYRLERLKDLTLGHPNIIVLPVHEVRNLSEMDLWYEAMLKEGIEGAILRDPNGPYKYGRSTQNEGWLMKLKPREDSEALVIEVQEEMHNANEALKDAFGRTERSTSKENLIGKGTMGALVVKDIKTGVEFSIGTGFNADDRKRQDWLGTIVKYSFTPVGVKDKPRHPVYHGDRDKDDM